MKVVMSKEAGRNLRISPHRRLVVDLMHFSRKVPSVALERRMNLSDVRAARSACAPRPTWTAILTKAYAIVSARTPALRQSYMTVPWPRIYQHPRNMATLNISRRVGDENIVIYAHVRQPQNRTLSELDAIIRHHRDVPLEELKSFRRARRLGRLPRPLRRFVWWAGLNWFGRRRSHNFGTFGITSVAGHGAGILQLVPLLTSTLYYGLFDDAGALDMRLTFDHRVLDGATAADVLAQLEEVLHHEILTELQGFPTSR
jgi:hypothetical protein